MSVDIPKVKKVIGLRLAAAKKNATVFAVFASDASSDEKSAAWLAAETTIRANDAGWKAAEAALNPEELDAFMFQYARAAERERSAK